MENPLKLVCVIEVVPNCGGEPVRFAYLKGKSLTGSAGVIVRDDDPPDDAPRYFLHVPCRKTAVDRIAHIYGLHDGAYGEGGRVTLAENGDAFCIDDEGCAFRGLSIEELFFPLCAYHLTTNESARPPHRDN